MAIQQGRSERRGESYFVPYGEPLSDARTLLVDFFSILQCRSLCERERASIMPRHTQRL